MKDILAKLNEALLLLNEVKMELEKPQADKKDDPPDEKPPN